MNRKSYEDLIFENRNKAYGAYELRVSYERTLMRSFFLGIAGLASMAFVIYQVNHMGPELPMKVKMTDKIDMSKIFTTEKFEVEPPAAQYPKPVSPPSVPKAPSVPDPRSFQPVVQPIAPAVMPVPMPAVTPIDPGAIPGGSPITSIGVPPIPGGGGEPIGEQIMNMASVDKQPEFPGGIENFYKFLADKIRFPRQAVEEGISAKLFVSFVIDKSGKLTQIEFKKKVGYGMEEAVAQVLEKSPAWSPGQVSNSKVNTVMVLPVNFNLLK